MTLPYQRAVTFVYRGTRGFCCERDFVRYGSMGCHLDELAIDSGVRQVIHKIRNGESFEKMDSRDRQI
jgi:hypothetical protein